MKRKRRICVVVTDKAQLSRLLTLMRELDRSAGWRLQVVVAAGALTYRYGNVLGELKRHGFKPDVVLPTAIEGGEHVGMAKTAALGMLEVATALDNLKTEYVVVRGDRFEVLPIAAAAAYLNRVVVHLEGGDVSGSIDESVRHAITKLAHVHFVTNREARSRVIKMGEDRKMVFDVGSLDVDFLSKLRFTKRVPSELVNRHGVGAELDLREPYAVVLFNPVTTETRDMRRDVAELLAAVHGLAVQAVWVWPNLGAGSDAIAKKMREWQVRYEGQHRIRFVRYLGPENFAHVLSGAAVVAGNSSVGIKECAWLGVPAVNVGTRQAGRRRGPNVVDVGHERTKIAWALEQQLTRGRYRSSGLYGNGSTAKQIVRVLNVVEPVVQKRLTY